MQPEAGGGLGPLRVEPHGVAERSPGLQQAAQDEERVTHRDPSLDEVGPERDGSLAVRQCFVGTAELHQLRTQLDAGIRQRLVERDRTGATEVGEGSMPISMARTTTPRWTWAEASSGQRASRPAKALADSASKPSTCHARPRLA